MTDDESVAISTSADVDVNVLYGPVGLGLWGGIGHWFAEAHDDPSRFFWSYGPLFRFHVGDFWLAAGMVFRTIPFDTYPNRTTVEWKVVVGGDVRGWIAGSDNAFTRRLGVGPFIGFGAGSFRGHSGDTGFGDGNFAHVFFGLRFMYDTADTYANST